MGQKSFVVQPKGIFPSFLKIWLMKKDRKFPSLRCILDENSALIMECKRKENRSESQEIWVGFLSSTHFVNWNNRQHFWTSVSPLQSGVTGCGFCIAFPFQCSILSVSLFEEEPIFVLNMLAEDKIWISEMEKFFIAPNIPMFLPPLLF